MSQISSPLKYHGGKSYLANRIVALMPPHLHYVEPYAGGLSVLLAKDPEGVSEVVNDINEDLTVFWRCLQDPDSFANFQRMAQLTPFSEKEWEHARWCLKAAKNHARHYCRAVWFFIHCRMSLAGRMKSFAPLSKTRIRRGMNEQASAWLSAVEGLPEVHSRLQRVVILNQDALEVIKSQDGEQTLFYLDPPYVHDSRATTDDYENEMTIEQHQDLLALIREVKGKVMVSGYRNEWYDYQLASWNRHEFNLPNNAAGGTNKRRMIECVWCNFQP